MRRNSIALDSNFGPTSGLSSGLSRNKTRRMSRGSSLALEARNEHLKNLLDTDYDFGNQRIQAYHELQQRKIERERREVLLDLERKRKAELHGDGRKFSNTSFWDEYIYKELIIFIFVIVMIVYWRRFYDGTYRSLLNGIPYLGKLTVQEDYEEISTDEVDS